MNPSASGLVQRPSLALLGVEPFRAAFEFVRHHLVKANHSNTGDGRPVVVFPGLRADGSHIGMGWNREVLDAVTDRLGQAPGPWRRYVQAS